MIVRFFAFDASCDFSGAGGIEDPADASIIGTMLRGKEPAAVGVAVGEARITGATH